MEMGLITSCRDGPFGTAGFHCFDTNHPLYLRTAAITAIRAGFPVLRSGRQYLRPVSMFGSCSACSGW